MQKSLVFVIALLSLQLGTAQVNFFEGSWSEATAAAKEANKPIFLKAYTDWCYWCKVMDKETLTDEAVYTYLNDNFISYKADFEKGEGIDLAMKYRVTGFPTVLYFDAQGKLMDKSVGYDDDNQAFVEELRKLADPENGPKYRYPFSTALEADFPDFYKKSFGGSKAKEMPEPEVVAEFLNAQTDLYTEATWSVLYRFTVDQKYEDHILANKARYEALFGPGEVKSKIEKIVYARVKSAAESKDEIGLEAAMQIVDANFGDDAASVREAYSIVFYQKVGDWTKFSGAVDAWLAANEDPSSNRINGYAWTLYEECESREVLLKAQEWMVKVVDKEPTYAFLDTYAALLYKTGSLQEAKIWAEKAIAAAKEAGEGHEETDQLLDKITAAENN